MLNHLEKQLMEYFRSYREVSFVGLKRRFPNHFDKSPGRKITKGKDLLWTGVSSEMADSLKKLMKARALKVVKVPKRRYVLEGYDLRDKKWLPAALVYR